LVGSYQKFLEHISTHSFFKVIEAGLKLFLICTLEILVRAHWRQSTCILQWRLESLWKQSTNILQLRLGALSKQSTYALQWLLGALSKQSTYLWSAAEYIIWVD